MSGPAQRWVRIERPGPARLAGLGVTRWPIWEKEPSTFPWTYEQRESCWILEGQATLALPDGSQVSFGAGDLVHFAAGFTGTWTVHETVRKHYAFLRRRSRLIARARQALHALKGGAR